jgi:hypothetical protein
MPSTYEKISTTTLGASTSSVTLSSIPATYTDLVLIVNGKMVSGENSLGIRFNGDSGSNYSANVIYGDGTSAQALRFNNGNEIYSARMGSPTNSTSIFYIFNYSNTTTNKSIMSRGGSNGIIMVTAGMWQSTAAINSIFVRGFGAFSDFASGCTFTLYGIKAA